MLRPLFMTSEQLTEHRLTALELTQDDHGERITDLEHEREDKVRWSPRDYWMTFAGLAMVLAAVTEKIGWTTAVAGLAKLYGGK